MPEEDLFIIDELTVRRGSEKYPYVFYVIRDRPLNRLFLAPIWELISVERVRVDRVNKGKWIINLRNFVQVAEEGQIPGMIPMMLASVDWRQSNILTQLEVPQA